MSKNFTKLILIILLFGFNVGAKAQQWLGRSTGNYSGTYGVYNNASSIADSKYKYYFNFWGRGVNFYNDYLIYNAPIKINQWANNTMSLNNYRDYTGKIQMGDDWFKENINGKNKQFSFNQDIWGPAFMFPVSKNWNMSINTRQRSGLQMFGFSENASIMAKNGISNGQIASIKNGFSANIQSYQELSFTLGGIMAKNENHQLSGGATVKFIRGLGAAYIKGNELNIQGTGNNSALVGGDFQYAYTDDKAAVAPFNNPYGLFSLQSRGLGAGFDLGLTYTYRSDRLKYGSKSRCDLNDKRSDYDIKLSMGFNDVGGIRYNRNSTVYSYSSVASVPVSASSDILNGFGNANQNGFDSLGKNVFAQMGAAKSYGFSSTLPTAFNFQADFRFSKHFYTAVYLNQSLKGSKTTGLRSTSMLSIIPRLESKGFEFSMPVTLSENYKNFYIGAYARIGPVFFGSDNLGGLLNVASGAEFRGADIYGGISFGIGHCYTKSYRNNVDPVYIDTLQNDTIKSELKDTIRSEMKDTLIIRDTIKTIKKDTVYIDKKTKALIKRDTVYIEKIVKSNTDIERENAIKRKEAELNDRKVQLDAREKALKENEKVPYNETDAIKNCNDKNVVLVNENTTLKNKVNNQADVILQLQKQIEDLNKLKSTYELEQQKCNENRIKNNAEIIRLQEDILNANKRIAELQNEVDILKKANAAKNNAEVLKGSDAEKLAKVSKQVDSLKLVILYLESDMDKCRKAAEVEKAKTQNDAKIYKKQNDSIGIILTQKNAELENCKKNSTMNNAEVLKKAEADKAKAQNDAKVAQKTADSLAIILTQRNLDLENCKKNSTMNNAEVLKKAETDKAKAENDAKVSRKQADSLSLIVIKLSADLDNCKKNSSQNDAEVKLKKVEDENAMLKAEMLGMSKTIGNLNSKNYALSYRVDSLINALKNCCSNCGTGGNNSDELLKKCQEGNAQMEAEIIRLKSVISKRDNSLDSMETVVNNQNKKQVELNAQITKLNSDISDLKAKSSSSNCDEIQKQLDDKNSELNKVKNDNTVLQNQVNSQKSQLNQYKTEYDFLLKQSQKCNLKLDSCMRGLYNEPKGDTGAAPGGGGPHQGSNGTVSDSTTVASTSKTKDSSEVYSDAQINKGIEVGAQILNIIINSAMNNKHSNSGSSGSGSKKPNESSSGSGGSSGSRNDRPTESGSGSSTSGSNSGRSGSGSSGSTRRR